MSFGTHFTIPNKSFSPDFRTKAGELDLINCMKIFVLMQYMNVYTIYIYYICFDAVHECLYYIPHNALFVWNGCP